MAQPDMAALAGWLGLPPQELRDELKTVITDHVTGRLRQAVENGRLTQAQADVLLERLTSNLDRLIDQNMKAPGNRGPRAPGGGNA